MFLWEWGCFLYVQGLFHGMCHGQEARFIEVAPEELDSDRESVSVHRAGDGNAGKACEVGGNAVDLGHLRINKKNIAVMQLGRRSRSGGAEDVIDFGICLAEIFGNECPYFLSTGVIGIVIPGTQDVGA